MSRKIKDAVPSARIRGGGCEVRISAQDPGEVAEWAKDILEKVRGVESQSR